MTREEASDFLEKCRWWFEPYTSEKEMWNEALDMAIEALSADRPTGEWVEEDEYGDLWVCDQCGFANDYKDNYCPNCGARMTPYKGGEDE